MSAPVLWEPAPTPALWKPAPVPAIWDPSFGATNNGKIFTSKLSPASGGGFSVTTLSTLKPSGITVHSENEITGILDASGNLPVLAAVTLDGSLPTSGSAGSRYSCGNVQVGISSDSLAAAGLSATIANAALATARAAATNAFFPGTFAPAYGVDYAALASPGPFFPGTFAPVTYVAPVIEAAPYRYYY